MSLKFIRASITSKQILRNFSQLTATYSNQANTNMELKHLIKRLSEYGENKIACDWDNVGLLVEPSGPLQINKILVTNDLTEPVLEEAIAKRVNCIISYHPPIFAPLKRLTQVDWKQRSVVKCIEQRIAVYSPHTIWDAIEGGINDWIIQAFGT
jgi:putative NIF3 family GTP cyclohydrolase 1 type 2